MRRLVGLDGMKFLSIAYLAKCANIATMPETLCPCQTQSIKRQAEIFKALGHPARLAIVQSLADGERCVCEIHAEHDRDLSTTSRHLAVLVTAGILASDRRSNKIFYRLTMPCVVEMCHCIGKTDSAKGNP
jgi:ArsR family transcriptional regulator